MIKIVTLASNVMFIHRKPLQIMIYTFLHGRSNERYEKQDYNDVHLASDTITPGSRIQGRHYIWGQYIQSHKELLLERAVILS